MTRISAGNTLTNQYAPPFVVSNNVTTNWQLRWNATLIAFEAFDPDENVIAAGFDSIQQQLFLNTTNQQVFVVPWGVDTTATNPKASLYITINGVKQHTNTYTISAGTNTTSITLGGTTGIGDDVEVIGLQSTGGATVELKTATGDNAETDFDLTWLAPSEQSLLITLDGIKQDTSAYSIDNTSLTTTTVIFVDAPGSSVAIEVVGITTTGETPASPVDASNLGATPGREGIYSAKRQTGENQILDFKSLMAGSRITLTTPVAGEILIATDDITFANLGSGAQVISPNATTVDFSAAETLDFHTLNGGSQITLALAGGELTWSVDPGWVTAGATPHPGVAGNNIIAIESLPGAFTVVLPLISTLTVGEPITVKNQTGGTFTITIQPHATDGAASIDGAGTTTITTAYGYTTLYTDGTHFYIIAQG